MNEHAPRGNRPQIKHRNARRRVRRTPIVRTPMHITPFWVAALVSGCGILDPDDRLAELERSEALWRTQHAVHYRFQYRAACFCPRELLEPALVEVRQDSVGAVTLIEEDRAPSDAPLSTWWTIDELFQEIHQALERNADKMDVTYNSDTGYPEYIAIDYSVDVADDETTHWVSGLTIVGPSGSSPPTTH